MSDSENRKLNAARVATEIVSEYAKKDTPPTIRRLMMIAVEAFIRTQEVESQNVFKVDAEDSYSSLSVFIRENMSEMVEELFKYLDTRWA